MNQLNRERFALGIYDLIESLKPETLEDYNNMSQKFHELIESAIYDYLFDEESENSLTFDRDEYYPAF